MWYFQVEVNYKERRVVIGLLTINRHDVLFWLPTERAVKKGGAVHCEGDGRGGDSWGGTVHKTS